MLKFRIWNIWTSLSSQRIEHPQSAADCSKHFSLLLWSSLCTKNKVCAEFSTVSKGKCKLNRVIQPQNTVICYKVTLLQLGGVMRVRQCVCVRKTLTSVTNVQLRVFLYLVALPSTLWRPQAPSVPGGWCQNSLIHDIPNPEFEHWDVTIYWYFG